MAVALDPQASSGGTNTFRIDPSDNKHFYVVVADTEISVVVPDDSRTVSIASNLSNYWMGRGTSTIAVPTTTQLDYNLEYNPAVRSVRGGETLKLIANANGFMEVSFYN